MSTHPFRAPDSTPTAQHHANPMLRAAPDRPPSHLRRART